MHDLKRLTIPLKSLNVHIIKKINSIWETVERILEIEEGKLDSNPIQQLTNIQERI